MTSSSAQDHHNTLRGRIVLIENISERSVGFIQDYLDLYVDIKETERAVNEEMAAYEERELKVSSEK